MLLRNLNHICGLSNGSVGFIKYYFCFPRDDDRDRIPTEIDALIIHFPGYTGRVFYPENPTVVLIFKKTERAYGGSRTNFPVISSMAPTIHKYRGYQ